MVQELLLLGRLSNTSSEQNRINSQSSICITEFNIENVIFISEKSGKSMKRKALLN